MLLWVVKCIWIIVCFFILVCASSNQRKTCCAESKDFNFRVINPPLYTVSRVKHSTRSCHQKQTNLSMQELLLKSNPMQYVFLKGKSTAHLQATNYETARHHLFELLFFPSCPPLYILGMEQRLLLKKDVWPKAIGGLHTSPWLNVKMCEPIGFTCANR